MTREGLERTDPRVAELAFDAQRRRMSTVHRAGPSAGPGNSSSGEEPGGAYWVAVKGALGALLPLLADDTDPALVAAMDAAAEHFAGEGYRAGPGRAWPEPVLLLGDG